MSAAVNDRPNDLFLSRSHLPLTGELHPLRREFERLLFTGNAIALTFTLLACTVIYFWPREARVVPPISKLGKHFTQSPLPIPSGKNDTNFEGFMPADGPVVYEPSEDDLAIDSDTPANGSGDGDVNTDDLNSGGDFSNIWGEVDSIYVPEPPTQSTMGYMWDQAPELISIKAPHYPEMVREAGIDGTIHVRVLVGVDGRVRQATVVGGTAVLRNAAMDSARTALFKPAMQGDHVVEAWVVIPITFQLRARY